MKGDSARLAVVAASGCTVAIIEMGENDVNAGYTASQIEGFYRALGSQLKAAGVVRLYGMTLLPYTMSSNDYRDAAGQMSVTPKARRCASRSIIGSGRCRSRFPTSSIQL